MQRMKRFKINQDLRYNEHLSIAADEELRSG